MVINVKSTEKLFIINLQSTHYITINKWYESITAMKVIISMDWTVLPRVSLAGKKALEVFLTNRMAYIYEAFVHVVGSSSS